MPSSAKKRWIWGALVVLTPAIIYAANLTIPNNFSPNTPILSAQVNNNFSAVQTAVNSKQDALTVISGAIPAAGTGVAVPANGDFLYPVTNFNVGSASRCTIVSTGYICAAAVTAAQDPGVFAAYRLTGGANAASGFSCYLSPAIGYCTSCTVSTAVTVTPNASYGFGCDLGVLAAVAGQTGYCQTTVTCS
jgi:hypothetical protein